MEYPEKSEIIPTFVLRQKKLLLATKSILVDHSFCDSKLLENGGPI
jgi:hypothetical protein